MTGPTCDCCETFLLRLCRVLGLATALGLWGVGVEAIYYHHSLGFYLVPLAVIITFLETAFVLHYCVEVCVSPRSICARVWKGVLWVDDWRKGVPYLLLAVPCFLSPRTVMLALVSGGMLAVTGVLYCIKTYKTRRGVAVEQFIAKRPYDRFEEEEVEEDLEEDIVNPTGNISSMSVADQIEVLEV